MPWSALISILLDIWDQVFSFSDQLGAFLSSTFTINDVSYSYLSVFFGASIFAYFTYMFVKWVVPV